MIIRQAEAKDAQAVAAICNDVIDNTAITFTTIRKSTKDIAAEIATRGNAFHVAEIDGLPVGYTTYFPFRGGPGYAHTVEYSIALHASARGHGTGRALLLTLEQVARRAGVHALIGGGER